MASCSGIRTLHSGFLLSQELKAPPCKHCTCSRAAGLKGACCISSGELSGQLAIVLLLLTGLQVSLVRPSRYASTLGIWLLYWLPQPSYRPDRQMRRTLGVEIPGSSSTSLYAAFHFSEDDTASLHSGNVSAQRMAQKAKQALEHLEAQDTQPAVPQNDTGSRCIPANSISPCKLHWQAAVTPQRIEAPGGGRSHGGCSSPCFTK